MKKLNLKEVQSWTKREMLSFLAVRDVTINRKMLKKELISKVRDKKDLPEVNEFLPFSGSDMRQMILVMNAFLSSLFAMDMSGSQSRNRLYSLARLYLCFSSRLDKYLMQKNPSWTTTFSLLGMLRVADTFELAPYPICFYEGDGMGEGIIKEIRPILLTGLRKGWTVAGQETFYRMKTLLYMQDLLLNKHSLSLVLLQKKPVRSKTKIYKFSADVQDALANQKPFAFSLFKEVFTNERVMGIIICFHKKYYIRVIHVHDQPSFHDPNGFAYFTTTMIPKIEHIIIDKDKLNIIALT